MYDRLSREELARFLGRDCREIEKLVQRGRIPGRKMLADWHSFQPPANRLVSCWIGRGTGVLNLGQHPLQFLGEL